MKTRKTARESHEDRCLRGFVRELVRAPAEDRPVYALSILAVTNVETLRMLVEGLVERLEDDGSHAGAVGMLVALGANILPALESVVQGLAPERRSRGLKTLEAVRNAIAPSERDVPLGLRFSVAVG